MQHVSSYIVNVWKVPKYAARTKHLAIVLSFTIWRKYHDSTGCNLVERRLDLVCDKYREKAKSLLEFCDDNKHNGKIVTLHPFYDNFHQFIYFLNYVIAQRFNYLAHTWLASKCKKAACSTMHFLIFYFSVFAPTANLYLYNFRWYFQDILQYAYCKRCFSQKQEA